MKTSHTSRLITSIVAIFSMLFMQLAVAAYACPGEPSGSQNVAHSASVVTVGMVNCDGMDSAQPTLCQMYGHGDSIKQSLDKTPVPDVPPFVPTTLGLDLHIFDVVNISTAQPYLPITLTRTTAPPIAIRNCCFRL